MSKDNTAGGGGKTGTEQEEEEFVAIEVDGSGKPINQQSADDQSEEHEDETDDQDDDQDEDGHDVDQEERLGHAEGDQEDETPEQRRDRRRREQRAKRVRNRVAAESKDRLIQNQGRMLLTLQEQVAQLQGRSVQYDVKLLQSQLSQIEAQQTDAKAVLAKLVKAGDGEGVAEITELQMSLREQHGTITEQLRRAKKGPKATQPADAEDESGEPRQTPQQRRGPAPDPEVVRQAQSWAAKYKWADPRQGDPEEVQIVRAIDHNLHQEGWDPRSQDYWAELTSRVRRRLPHHFKKAAPNGEGNGERRVSNDNGGKRPAQGGPRMAPASQSGGASRPLGKNEVRVTPERKAAMQAAGKWDDPVKRNRMLAEYARYDRANAGQN